MTKKTFLNLPSSFCGADSFFHILPIPYEGTVCFEHGTVLGPDRILDVSDQMEWLDEETRRPFYRPGIFTHPPIPPRATPHEEMAAIEETVRTLDLFRPDRFPIFLGGEHSITAPILRVAAEKHRGLSVLQFDAHSDLRDSFPPGGKDSHASVMRRVSEITPTLVQVGIRSFPEEDLIESPDRVDRFLTPTALEEDFPKTLGQILDQLGPVVYITFDMDAFDPGIAPGVGTPEPGGLTWRQATRILREVFAAKRVIGGDIVETAPIPGQVTTEFLAARLAAKFMAYREKKDHE